MHISMLSQSTSSALDHSGVKTCRVAETRAPQLPHSGRTTGRHDECCATFRSRCPSLRPRATQGFPADAHTLAKSHTFLHLLKQASPRSLPSFSGSWSTKYSGSLQQAATTSVFPVSRLCSAFSLFHCFAGLDSFGNLLQQLRISKRTLHDEFGWSGCSPALPGICKLTT